MESFLISTLVVTLAEMGDKTQLLTLLLVTRFKNKGAILLGILIATLVNHGLSAWFGQWLGDAFAGTWMQLLLALSFALMGVWLLIPDKADDEGAGRWKMGAFLTTLVLFSLAELGDKTQVATVLLAVEMGAMWAVLAGSTLGMLLANLPVLWLGDKLMQWVPVKWTTRIACGLFFAMAAWVAIQAL